MKLGESTIHGASTESEASRVVSRTGTAGESPYTPLDINDPEGRFGTWMPGDDPDDWR